MTWMLLRSAHVTSGAEAIARVLSIVGDSKVTSTIIVGCAESASR